MVERNLSDLEPGDKCKVTHVGGSGGERRRMMDMGIVRGSRIEVVRKAPMGDPVELKWMLFAIAYLMTLAGLISLVIIGIGHLLLGMPIQVQNRR